jgi:hypothetical protein
LEQGIREGENPVLWLGFFFTYGTLSKSRVVWDCSSNWEVNYLLKLNTGERPIANKYCEGKMKRILKRELKVPEIVIRESIAVSVVFEYFSVLF